MQAAFILKNDRERRHRLLVFLLIILHFIFFIFLIINHVMWEPGVAGVAAIAINGAYMLWFSKMSGRKFHFSDRLFFFFGISFCSTGVWWIFFLETSLSILFLFYYQIKVISFSPFLVEYNARPRKKYKWLEFNNVILKDNILTLDFKNNKLFQAEIENSNIDQDQFNAFAKDHLTKDI